MIKNVVFDFGRVLVEFDPEYMTGKYISDPDDKKFASEVIFDRLYWDRLDAGTISDDELMEGVRSRLPERLWEAADKVYANWYRNLPQIPGMWELMRMIKEKYGVRVFILSNISKGFAAHSGEIPILAEAEICIFSAVCGHIKPDPDMFGYLCGRCGIEPEETVFIDDNPKNVEGAGKCGICGYLFDGNVGALEKYLHVLLQTK